MTILRLALVSLALCVLAACGGGATQHSDPLADASATMADRGTARASFDAHYGSGDEAASQSCEAALDFERERARLSCEAQGEIPADDLIIVGKTWYSQLPGGKWMKLPADPDDSDGLAEMDPRAILGDMQAAAEEVSVVGEDQVRGVNATHYHFVVDAKKAAELQPAGGVDTAPVDIWIDEDGLVRRLRATDDGGGDASGQYVVEFFDFGADLDIEPPPADTIAAGDDYGGTGVSLASSCKGPGPRPIDFDAFAEAIFTSGWADDAGPAAAPYSCDDTQFTFTLGKSVACSLHDGPVAGDAVQRRSESGKTVLAIENASCAVTGDDATTERRVEALLVQMAKS